MTTATAGRMLAHTLVGMHQGPLVDDQADGRPETESQRYDRNWNELLQELRVTQTGTQILAGFLLTLAFQPRFAELDGYQVTVYLCLILLAILATILGLAPVALHRLLFRQRAKGPLVEITSRIVLVMMIAIGLLFIGIALFIADVVLGRAAGFVTAGAVLVLIVGVWTVLPAAVKARLRKVEIGGIERK